MTEENVVYADFGDGDDEDGETVVRIIVEGPPELVDDYLSRFNRNEPDDRDPYEEPEVKNRTWLWVVLGFLAGLFFGG